MVPLLKGVKVLEIGAVVMGPFAGQILADLGAEVLKIETIEGDIARSSFPQGAGTGALFINNNRNKRVISLDLKAERGKEILERLIARHDVILHNMRTDAAERLGIGFDRVSALNPRIIYCSAVGFGRGGRYRNRPAFDDIIQAASGFASFTGGEPHFVPTIVADKIGALYTVYGILAALVARRSGEDAPLQVEVPMFEALASFILNEHLAAATFDENGAVGYPDRARCKLGIARRERRQEVIPAGHGKTHFRRIIALHDMIADQRRIAWHASAILATRPFAIGRVAPRRRGHHGPYVGDRAEGGRRAGFQRRKVNDHRLSRGRGFAAAPI